MTDIKKDENEENRNKRSLTSKVAETGFLFLTWLALSTYVEIYGPTLIDLKIKLKADYEQVAVAVSGRSVGWFPGSLLAGILVDKFSRYCHLMIAIGLDIAAGVTVAIPWSPNITYMWLFCFVGGFVESILNIAGTLILFNIWKDKTTSYLMLIHLGYGVGSFIVPLYSNPFLAEIKTESLHTNMSLYNNSTTESLKSLTTNTFPGDGVSSLQPEDSKIEYAYAISGSVVAAISVAFYIYQVQETKLRTMTEEDTIVKENTKTEHRTFKEIINPATCADGRFWYGSSILFLLFFCFGNIGGGDRMIGSFIRSYAIDQLGFTKDAASLLNTSYWITFSAGRLILIFISRYLSVRFLIVLEASGMAISSILLVILAGDNSLYLWIFIQFFSFSSAATWPTAVAWTDYHIELTGLGMTLQVFGASIGGICHMRLIGYLYENYGPKTFLFQTLGYGVFHFMLTVCLDLVGAQHGNRFKSKNIDIVEIEMEENSVKTK